MAPIETRDVLTELAEGRTSLADVERLYERVMASEHAADAPALLGLSAVEWTAFCQGAHWDDLARFRREGWPRTCGVCGRALAVAAFGWLVREHEGGVALIHVECA